MNRLHYIDGREIRLGDQVRFGDMVGRVVICQGACVDVETYGRPDGSDPEILVDFGDSRLFGFGAPEHNEHLELVARSDGGLSDSNGRV